MGRPSFGGIRVAIVLGEGMAERIDAVSGNRSDFIRAAIEEKLSGVRVEVPASDPVVPKSEAPAERVAVPRKAVARGRAVRDVVGDEAAVRGLLADRPRSVRALAGELGWPEMRVERALRGLAVFYSQGLVFLE